MGELRTCYKLTTQLFDCIVLQGEEKFRHEQITSTISY